MGFCEFDASLVCILKSRIAGAIGRDPVSKNKEGGGEEKSKQTNKQITHKPTPHVLGKVV